VVQSKVISANGAGVGTVSRIKGVAVEGASGWRRRPGGRRQAAPVIGRCSTAAAPPAYRPSLTAAGVAMHRDRRTWERLRASVALHCDKRCAEKANPVISGQFLDTTHRASHSSTTLPL
jgi:hypothetical protein